MIKAIDVKVHHLTQEAYDAIPVPEDIHGKSRWKTVGNVTFFSPSDFCDGQVTTQFQFFTYDRSDGFTINVTNDEASHINVITHAKPDTLQEKFDNNYPDGVTVSPDA